MLVTPQHQKHMYPCFMDFASSSFDAILYNRRRSSVSSLHSDGGDISETSQSHRRESHLPDLLPFIQMVTEKCNIQPVQMVMALIYVQRFRESLPEGFHAEAEAAHRIFAASLLIASKYSDDHCLSTRRLVRATGDVWSIKEMTRMELALLRFLKWDVHIHPDEMTAFLQNLDYDPSMILPTLP